MAKAAAFVAGAASALLAVWLRQRQRRRSGRGRRGVRAPRNQAANTLRHWVGFVEYRLARTVVSLEGKPRNGTPY